jgi:hypothetical protein
LRERERERDIQTLIEEDQHTGSWFFEKSLVTLVHGEGGDEM